MSSADRTENPATAIVTVLRSHGGALAKRYDGHRMVGFTAGLWFRAYQGELDASFGLLERIARNPFLCVVRGNLRPGVDRRRCRRLSAAGHGEMRTLEPASPRWLAVDVDKLDEPPGLTFAAEPEDGVEHVLGLLPEPLRDASCWWQATSSAGIKPGISCRVWFLLSRGVSDAEAKGWLKGCPVDPTLFNPATPHYTAPPILTHGVPDTVAKRSGVRRGLEDVVEVPPVLPRVESVPAQPVALDGHELTEQELDLLEQAAIASPVARDIWSGRRRYPDRSTAHFSLLASLARGGLHDPETLQRVLLAFDRRHGLDPSKTARADYVARTVGAAIAAARER